jgi:MFS transporter, SP family, solute carrier family 2 (facilitated glucose transporter), member 3
LIVTMPLVMAVLVAVMAQFLVGYNTGVMNAPEAVVFPGHTMLQWGMAVSAFAVGGPFGSVIGGVLANQWGRRGAMMANVWVFLTGGVLMTAATSIFQLIAARFIIGFASGLSSVVVPVYLGEIAPPTLRGTLGTCTQFALVVGILASDLFAFPFATADMWRYLFCVTPVLCVVQLLLSSFLVESPRWLLSTNSSSSSARVAIKQLRGYRFDEDVETEVDNFLCASQKHKTGRSSAHSSGALWDLLHCKEMRVLVVAAVVLQMAQQLCGINAVFYYSTSFFEGVISSPLVGTTLVGVVNVIATYVALQLMDTTARKTLLLWSCGGMLASAVVIILVLLGFMSRPVALLGVGAFVAFFEIGLGPIPWLIVAEMFDAKWVATAMSLCSLVNWVCNFVVGLMFPFMQAALGPYSFLPFGVVLLLTALFVSCNLPETYGRTVEEIQRIAGVGAGCHPREAARLTPHVHVVRGVENYDLDSQRAAATPMDENSSV